MTRREFVLSASALAVCGCRTSGAENALRAEMRRCVDAGLYSGLAVGSNRIAPLVAGSRTLDGLLPVTTETLFDLASVGKTQTAALCALLVADGKLDPDAPFTDYLTEHVLAKENCRITVRDLATHSGGFDNAKPYMVADHGRMFAEIYRKRPVRPRGEKFEYACSNFLYLGLIVEKLTGLDLDQAAKRMLWGPLGMRRTTWNTVTDDGNVMEYSRSTYQGTPRRIGEHNDVCCHLAPRPMGNGSCFSTCGDMLLFVTDMLRRERFPKPYYDLMFAPSFEKGGVRRSFGWDMTAPASSTHLYPQTGFSPRAIAHSGWTGPVIAVDPERNFAGVVLGGQVAGKAKTMDVRVRLLQMSAGLGILGTAYAMIEARQGHD